MVLDNSINGTFLHRREFMEYHGDRFEDASLVIYNEDFPVAILPAEKEENSIFSHRGLTYAGWILIDGLGLKDIQGIIKHTKAFYQNQGIERLEIRMVPDFFAKESQKDLKLAVQICGGESVFTAVHHCTSLPYRVTDRGKKWGRKKAIEKGLEIRASSDLKSFWEKILVPNLEKQHGVKPAHSLQEIQYLKSVFPDHIRFFAVFSGDEMLGGALIFSTDTSAHLQYTAALPLGKKQRCLDYLLSHLIEEEFSDKSFFNMGVSHIPETGQTNCGLVKWKESFGGKSKSVNTLKLQISKK
ncbi:hypothetical protein B879_02689 [Cecembia lonarensis LW9]|uniref:BioF2-like acetyltransferase domain-containing protein n=2 Tax=Cecembia TaxID=1187078 RepID=K1KXC0_CECL9|nr:hypothetical protein B879_02689 [Cecembia lonarensis LW9]